jgi:hypothetical protein
MYRWFYSKIAEDIRFLSATSSIRQEVSLHILTGGSSGDELIPNSELSRNSFLHESVHVWLTGILELASQQTLLSSLNEEKSVSLKLVLCADNLLQIVDHIITTTDTLSKIRQL